MIVVALVLSGLMGIVLGLLGGGGSILTLPILVEVLGLEPKEAITISLLVVGLTSSVAAVMQWRSGHVDLRIGLFFASFAMVGAYAGGRVAAFVPGQVLMGLFVTMMLATGLAMLRPKSERSRLRKPLAPGWVAIEGLAVGAFTGMVGAGGGFLVVPVLVLLANMPLRRAIGTSLMVIALKSFAGLAGYAAHVEVDFGVAGPLVVLAVIGALVGHRLSKVVDTQHLRLGFAYFVVVVGVYSGVSTLQAAHVFTKLDGAPWLAVVLAVLIGMALAWVRKLYIAARASGLPLTGLAPQQPTRP